MPTLMVVLFFQGYYDQSLEEERQEGKYLVEGCSFGKDRRSVIS